MSIAVPLPDQDVRDAIATHLDETLVVEAAAGTGKTTEMVRRIMRVLAGPGVPVLVESPTYPNALATLSSRRARIATHGIDAAAGAGWDADLLLGSLRQTGPRLAYVIPEFHNPTGHLTNRGGTARTSRVEVSVNVANG